MRVGNNVHTQHHQPRQPELAAARAREHPGIVNKGQNFLNGARGRGDIQERDFRDTAAEARNDMARSVHTVRAGQIDAATGIGQVEQEKQEAITNIRAEAAEAKQSLRQELKKFLKQITRAGALPETIAKIKEAFKKTVIRPLNFQMRESVTKVEVDAAKATQAMDQLSTQRS